jgi:hypothetical protein
VSDYRLYIPHVNRVDLLDKAVYSVGALRHNVTIIDNSANGLGMTFPEGEIIRPTVPLLFFQTMNFMLQDAKRRGCKFYLFLHSDGEVQSGFALKMVELARAQTGNWGIIFSLYDVFAAYNVGNLLEKVGLWDNNLPWYFADNDYYRRVRLAGLEVIEAGGEDVTHVGSSTINSDLYLRHVNGVTFPLYGEYYRQRWGGDPGKEIYTAPFGMHQ